MRCYAKPCHATTVGSRYIMQAENANKTTHAWIITTVYVVQYSTVQNRTNTQYEQKGMGEFP